MTVHMLIREDQNEDGSSTRRSREYSVSLASPRGWGPASVCAQQEGLLVVDDESPDGEWQVSWKVDEHRVD